MMYKQRPTRTPLRSLRPRTVPLLIILAASASLSIACSKSQADSDRIELGMPDQAHNDVLSVDELQIRGSIENETLRIRVPLTSLAKEQQKGELNLRLLGVDGKTEEAVVKLDYSLAAGESKVFTAELPAPSGLGTQEQLVDWNIRVDDESQLRVTRSLLYVVPLYDLWVEGPAKLPAGKKSYYRVRTHDALDNQPIDEQEVSFEIVQNDKVVDTQTVKTNATGDAQVEVELADAGEFELRLATSAHGTHAGLQEPLKVDDGTGKLLLTTDKPIYQPGQLVHLRSLSLSQDGNKPVQGAKTIFEIEDGKGNKVFKSEVTTDNFGVAFDEFRIGNIVNEGTYKVRVVGSEITSEKTFNVSHYALPKFEVSLTTDEPWYPPGSTISGAIDSRYFFGKSVSGSIAIEAYSIDVGTTLFAETMGTLNANGHYDFSIQLPQTLPSIPLGQGDAVVELRAVVTDSAGQQVEKSRMLTVSAQGANVALVPESGFLVPGVENDLLLFASDPLGAPIPGAQVEITGKNDVLLLTTTDEFGQAKLSYIPQENADTSARGFEAKLTLEGGRSIESSFAFEQQNGLQHLQLRTDRSVYEVGETVKVTVNTSEPEGTVYVNWLNDGQNVDLRSLVAQKGQATFSTTIDTSLAGSNRIEAYLVDDNGQIVRTGRTIFARSDAALEIKVETDRDIYAPGSPAQLTLSVTDESGDPKVAALGLQIVDEAVFALVDAKPGLLRTYFEIEDQFSVPQYEIHAPIADFSRLLYTDTASPDEAQADAAQKRTGAALAAMKNTSLTGIQHGSLPQVLTLALQQLESPYDSAKTEMESVLEKALSDALETLEENDCVPYACGNDDFFERLGQRVSSQTRLYDFWGNEFELSLNYSHLVLQGSGPDEKKLTADDATFSYPLHEFDLSADLDIGWGNQNDVLLAAPEAATVDTGDSGDSSSEADDGPRVRTDFPETLYVNPSVITDGNGQAIIDLNMADSITEWRLSALANSQDGSLGGVESGITVFQDFFVDVNFPAQLTRGDEVTFPIAVYNYLETEQVVNLELQPGAWYTPLGATTTSVTLKPGEVRGLGFPVRVNSVGLQTLTVIANGEEKSDAVARTVRVVPDGRAYPRAYSGSLETASVSQQVSFPVNAVPGSEQLYVDIFPAFLSQAVQGMDSILATPNGCFEQTTSSAWPNVLVTEYMQETGQITPEIEMKAEALMSAGYQRLLTFEHAGGGFSWFGEQDPAPYLSVTSFGIMEFADMSRVHTVDQAMLARTVEWVETQQKSDGSFEGDQSEFFSFHTSVVRNTAFTAWALASTGLSDTAVQKALDYVKANLGSDNDAYTLGIVANAFAVGAPNDVFLTDVFENLESLSKSEGDSVYWDSGDTQTNFYGGGSDAAVSSTALVTHALLLSGAHPNLVEGALQYLTSKKDANGNFGSTQATIWALRTLLLSAKKGTDGAEGTLMVSMNGQVIQSIELTEDRADVMTRVDLSGLTASGDHTVELDFAGSGKPSFNIVASHHLPWAEVPAALPGPLSIDVNYDKTSLFVNDSVRTTVTVKNNEAVTQNMVLVTLGIAPGFQVDTDDLQKYLDNGAISRFEVTGRQLILYITKLGASESSVISYDLTATMPVTAADGGAEVSMYYEPEKRTRAAAQQLAVTQN